MKNYKINDKSSLGELSEYIDSLKWYNVIAKIRIQLEMKRYDRKHKKFKIDPKLIASFVIDEKSVLVFKLKNNIPNSNIGKYYGKLRQIFGCEILILPPEISLKTIITKKEKK